jgi:hypothetical protein
VTTCYPCADATDCVSGQCLVLTSANNCWEDCSYADCRPYTECQDVNVYGTVMPLCVMPEGWTCAQVTVCTEECPEGPDSCSDDAPARCR